MTIVPHEHLTEDATDEQIARAIAGYLLNAHAPGGPYKLAYDYLDRTQPPPVKADKLIHKHRLACIERKDKEQARKWIVECALAKQTIHRFIGEGWVTLVASGSVGDVRRRLARKLKAQQLDDEIPF